MLKRLLILGDCNEIVDEMLQPSYSPKLDNEIDIERIMELDLLARSIAKNYVEKI